MQGESMRPDVRHVSAAFAIAVFAALSAMPQLSAASPPSTGSGAYTVTGFVTTDVRTTDDGNVVIVGTETAVLTGTLEGTFVHDVTIAIQTDGSLTFHGTGTFSGTVDGVSGGFEYSIRGKGVLGPAAALHGTLTILSGSGGLVDLAGRGTFQGIPMTGGTYAVQTH